MYKYVSMYFRHAARSVNLVHLRLNPSLVLWALAACWYKNTMDTLLGFILDTCEHLILTPMSAYMSSTRAASKAVVCFS